MDHPTIINRYRSIGGTHIEDETNSVSSYLIEFLRKYCSDKIFSTQDERGLLEQIKDFNVESKKCLKVLGNVMRTVVALNAQKPENFYQQSKGCSHKTRDIIEVLLMLGGNPECFWEPACAINIKGGSVEENLVSILSPDVLSLLLRTALGYALPQLVHRLLINKLQDQPGRQGHISRREDGPRHQGDINRLEDGPRCQGDINRREDEPRHQGDISRLEDVPRHQGDNSRLEVSPHRQGDISRLEDGARHQGDISRREDEPRHQGDISRLEDVPCHQGDISRLEDVPRHQGDNSRLEVSPHRQGDTLEQHSQHFPQTLLKLITLLYWTGVDLRVYTSNCDIFLHEDLAEIRNLCKTLQNNPRSLAQCCRLVLQHNLMGSNLMYTLHFGSLKFLPPAFRKIILLEHLSEVKQLE